METETDKEESSSGIDVKEAVNDLFHANSVNDSFIDLKAAVTILFPLLTDSISFVDVASLFKASSSLQGQDNLTTTELFDYFIRAFARTKYQQSTTSPTTTDILEKLLHELKHASAVNDREVFDVISSNEVINIFIQFDQPLLQAFKKYSTPFGMEMNEFTSFVKTYKLIPKYLPNKRQGEVFFSMIYTNYFLNANKKHTHGSSSLLLPSLLYPQFQLLLTFMIMEHRKTLQQKKPAPSNGESNRNVEDGLKYQEIADLLIESLKYANIINLPSSPHSKPSATSFSLLRRASSSNNGHAVHATTGTSTNAALMTTSPRSGSTKAVKLPAASTASSTAPTGPTTSASVSTSSPSFFSCASCTRSSAANEDAHHSTLSSKNGPIELQSNLIVSNRPLSTGSASAKSSQGSGSKKQRSPMKPSSVLSNDSEKTFDDKNKSDDIIEDEDDIFAQLHTELHPLPRVSSMPKVDEKAGKQMLIKVPSNEENSPKYANNSTSFFRIPLSFFTPTSHNRSSSSFGLGYDPYKHQPKLQQEIFEQEQQKLKEEQAQVQAQINQRQQERQEWMEVESEKSQYEASMRSLKVRIPSKHNLFGSLHDAATLQHDREVQLEQLALEQSPHPGSHHSSVGERVFHSPAVLGSGVGVAAMSRQASKQTPKTDELMLDLQPEELDGIDNGPESDKTHSDKYNSPMSSPMIRRAPSKHFSGNGPLVLDAKSLQAIREETTPPSGGFVSPLTEGQLHELTLYQEREKVERQRQKQIASDQAWLEQTHTPGQDLVGESSRGAWLDTHQQSLKVRLPPAKQNSVQGVLQHHGNYTTHSDAKLLQQQRLEHSPASLSHTEFHSPHRVDSALVETEKAEVIDAVDADEAELDLALFLTQRSEKVARRGTQEDEEEESEKLQEEQQQKVLIQQSLKVRQPSHGHIAHGHGHTLSHHGEFHSPHRVDSVGNGHHESTSSLSPPKAVVEPVPAVEESEKLDELDILIQQSMKVRMPSMQNLHSSSSSASTNAPASHPHDAKSLQAQRLQHSHSHGGGRGGGGFHSPAGGGFHAPSGFHSPNQVGITHSQPVAHTGTVVETKAVEAQKVEEVKIMTTTTSSVSRTSITGIFPPQLDHPEPEEEDKEDVQQHKQQTNVLDMVGESSRGAWLDTHQQSLKVRLPPAKQNSVQGVLQHHGNYTTHSDAKLLQQQRLEHSPASLSHTEFHSPAGHHTEPHHDAVVEHKAEDTLPQERVLSSVEESEKEAADAPIKSLKVRLPSMHRHPSHARPGPGQGGHFTPPANSIDFHALHDQEAKEAQQKAKQEQEERDRQEQERLLREQVLQERMREQEAREQREREAQEKLKREKLQKQKEKEERLRRQLEAEEAEKKEAQRLLKLQRQREEEEEYAVQQRILLAQQLGGSGDTGNGTATGNRGRLNTRSGSGSNWMLMDDSNKSAFGSNDEIQSVKVRVASKNHLPHYLHTSPSQGEVMMSEAQMQLQQGQPIQGQLSSSHGSFQQLRENFQQTKSVPSFSAPRNITGGSTESTPTHHKKAQQQQAHQPVQQTVHTSVRRVDSFVQTDNTLSTPQPLVEVMARPTSVKILREQFQQPQPQSGGARTQSQQQPRSLSRVPSDRSMNSRGATGNVRSRIAAYSSASPIVPPPPPPPVLTPPRPGSMGHGTHRMHSASSIHHNDPSYGYGVVSSAGSHSNSMYRQASYNGSTPNHSEYLPPPPASNSPPPSTTLRLTLSGTGLSVSGGASVGAVSVPGHKKGLGHIYAAPSTPAEEADIEAAIQLSLSEANYEENLRNEMYKADKDALEKAMRASMYEEMVRQQSHGRESGNSFVQERVETIERRVSYRRVPSNSKMSSANNTPGQTQSFHNHTPNTAMGSSVSRHQMAIDDYAQYHNQSQHSHSHSQHRTISTAGANAMEEYPYRVEQESSSVDTRQHQQDLLQMQHHQQQRRQSKPQRPGRGEKQTPPPLQQPQISTQSSPYVPYYMQEQYHEQLQQQITVTSPPKKLVSKQQSSSTQHHQTVGVGGEGSVSSAGQNSFTKQGKSAAPQYHNQPPPSQQQQSLSRTNSFSRQQLRNQAHATDFQDTLRQQEIQQYMEHVQTQQQYGSGNEDNNNGEGSLNGSQHNHHHRSRHYEEKSQEYVPSSQQALPMRQRQNYSSYE